MEQQTLERILDISRRMAETRNLEPLLAYAITEAIDLVGAERGYLVLINADGGLDFRVKRDRDGNDLDHAEDQISTSIFNQVIESHKPLVLNDALTDPDFSTAKSVMALQLRSVMCVPMVAQGTAIGAIYVENRSNSGIFIDADTMPLILFANQAAVAIENAMLNEGLEQRVADRTRELQEALSQIEQSWMGAVEADRMRTAVLSHVAHDVRAPLNITTTALQLMIEGEFGDVNDEQLEWLTKSLQAANHARDLMNDVFDMAKIEAGKLGLDLVDVPLPEFLNEIYSIAIGLPATEGVKLELDIPDDLPPTLRIDPTRIRQVFFNLISNALKYTKQGAVTIHARVLPEVNSVLMGVRDTGEGIPQDKLNKVFDRFTQVDSNPSRRQMGMGLGLAICRELVEMHGGRIWAESGGANTGTDFKFTLPM